jgi:hypothetical protein
MTTNTEAINWDFDLTPAVIIPNRFIYAGHSMTVGIFEDETSEDVSWTIASTGATPIEGGTYPTNFAELEACEIISNEIISWKTSVDTASEMATVIETNIARCISKGLLESAN